MKPANTITTTFLVCVLAAGAASAQNPSIIQNTRDTMNGVSSRDRAASNDALGVSQPAPAVQADTTGKTEKALPGKVSAGVKHSTSGKRAQTAKHGPSVGVFTPVSKSTPPIGVSATTGNAASDSYSEGNEQPVVPDAKYNANGRRDPFISPVVSHASGSGCSTGKKCLEIGTINLRGVVRGEGGFIAVVSNGLNKSYFLRENDPVFNGYVVKITGDSIVFQETLQNRLGKSFTREVVKKITTPAV